MPQQEQLYWRCRRGTRELDLMLMRYLEESYPHSDVEQQASFERLLELPDPELQHLLLGEGEASDAETRQLIRRMRQVRPDTS